MKIVDIESWNRKEHFEFFSGMANPYFGFTTEVDCTKAYDIAKEKGYSFFAYYFHKSMVAANSVDELKLRILDGQVVQFDTVHAGSTIGRPDGTFGFSFTHFSADFEVFNTSLQKEIQEVHASTGLRLSNNRLGKDHIRHTTIPWNSFSAIVHPTDFNTNESVPKISFGKFSIRDGRKYLPVSIEAHHGLADGIHLAKYVEAFQKELNRE
ncbi:chloramphenicol acetyltransferase [Chryseobacterium sp. P1-3]|uniref:Chloramphenicol acetyltransferase n=1 Tax=Chryseobacterium gallinarum TaxID=1324352 RepID=A0A0G3MAP3_CHRGL|nr:MULTISPECIES: chloramphenicol acetyltransferase [Chryseobacterium]AKK74117.1 chloramphenicol acetyltransferase [Chryseobacterium gallinarum]KFF74657.1 chloramphenicol acetyltransferase [Chryseobacterium sp. P1-3]MCL8537938.1 chloramphenicol acetyltransferase [Chryseobacterium gallinarum]QIY90076.1 chloramphenicol acetyltransferase [Chryseobacterium gallinarum]